jgi:hypothetical protein
MLRNPDAGNSLKTLATRGLSPLQGPAHVLAHHGAGVPGAPAGRAQGAHRGSSAGSAAMALPMATATLRSQRSWPMRRIGLPSVRRRNSASVQANS